MKRIVLTVAVLIVLVSGYLVAAQPSLAAESSKPITMKVSMFFAQGSWMGKQYQSWADELAKRTNGRVKADMFWMDSLVKQADMLPGLKAKMTDAGYLSQTYFPSNFPLLMMVDNFGNAGKDYGAAVLALLDTEENEPNLKTELEKEGVVPIAPYFGGVGHLAVGKRVNSFSEIKGKTIRTFGGTGLNYFKALGMNPIFMPYTDIYEAVSRGTIDGFQMVLPLSDAFKHYEVVRNIACISMGAPVGPAVMMRRDLFLSLPPDIQKIIVDLRKDFGVRYAEAVKNDFEAVAYHRWVFEYGVTLLTLTPEEKAFNAKAIETANDLMIKEQEGKGHKAAGKVWDYYMKALKKYTDERAKKS
jgi:TRAP-type C4-dicarboxylate transport system substrate-binding protein